MAIDERKLRRFGVAASFVVLMLFLSSACGSSTQSHSSGDLLIAAATPVQALDDESAVIEDRLTVVRVTLTSTFASEQDVPVRFFLSNCGGSPGVCSSSPAYGSGSSQPIIPVETGTHTYYVGPPAIAHGASLQDARACVNLDVDSGNTIPETDESNNQLTVCRPLVATQQFRIFYVPIIIHGDGPPTRGDVQLFAARSTDFVQGVYPVAQVGDRALESSVSCHSLSYPDEKSARDGLQHGDWRDDAGRPAPTTSEPHHDAYVGVFAEGAYTGGYGDAGFGQPQNGVILNNSVIEETQLDGMAAAQ